MGSLMKNIRTRVLVASVAAGLVSAAGGASADSKVVGQVLANPSATINAESSAKRIGSSTVPYIQGDTITTAEKSTAAVTLTSGRASFVAAPNTTMKVVDGDKGEVAIRGGAVKFSAVANFPVMFTSPVGTFVVRSDSDIDAVAVVDDGKFGVVAKNGSFVIESDNGRVVNKVARGEAYAYSNNAVEVVDVQAASNKTDLRWLWILLGTVGGIIILDEIFDDDDDRVPAVMPPASPS